MPAEADGVIVQKNVHLLTVMPDLIRHPVV
jgi:hypothetical protein